MRSVLAIVLLSLAMIGPVAAEPWRTLPPTPSLPPGGHSGFVAVGGARLWYASYGAGEAVILLHGGLANSDYWGEQIVALAAGHRVIVLDSRGHGRSARDAAPLHYRRMADDVVAVMDALDLKRAAIVGWSDGAIIGLELAIRHRERISRLFAFAGNADHSGLTPIANPVTWDAYVARTAREYAALSPEAGSPTPGGYAAFARWVGRMWASEPNIGEAALRGITTPCWIVLGDHDEAIGRPHSEYLARAIPGAKLVILHGVSHFAFLQDPRQFDAELLRFLDGG